MSTIEPELQTPTSSGPRKSPPLENSFRIGSILTRMFTPKQWGLRARFVYTTGILLLIGALVTLFTTSHILHDNAENAIREKLIDYELLIDRQIEQTSLLLMKTTAGAAALKTIAEALQNNSPETLQKTMLRISDKMRISTGLAPT